MLIDSLLLTLIAASLLYFAMQHARGMLFEEFTHINREIISEISQTKTILKEIKLMLTKKQDRQKRKHLGKKKDVK